MAQHSPQILGRYALMAEIAADGMATLHVGRALGSGGRVAIKRFPPRLAKDRPFLVDEACLDASVRHPNVVPTLELVDLDGELFLVTEYVEGETLGRLLKSARARGERVPPAIVAAILTGVLRGLDAAHEAKDRRGRPLGIIHRGVSPQNILVGVDGVARLLDLGVAKTSGAYSAPEQLRRTSDVSRRVDVYAAGVVLWEALTGVRLFTGQSETEVAAQVMSPRIVAPSARVTDLPSAFDAIALRALAFEPATRFATAREMANAIESACRPASASTVGAWVAELAHEPLAMRAAIVAASDREGELSPDEPSSKASHHSPIRSRRLLAVLALAVLALAAIGLIKTAALVQRREAPRSVVTAPAPVTPTVVPEPLASAPSPQTASAPASAAKTASPPARAASPRPARAVRAHCDPPYTIDDAGSRRFKSECF
jgi:eukaryotic-like serine/threonine-protein kinase